MTAWLASEVVYRQGAEEVYITGWENEERVKFARDVVHLEVATADEMAVHVRGPTIIVETLVNRPLEVCSEDVAGEGTQVTVVSSARLTHDDPRADKKDAGEE